MRKDSTMAVAMEMQSRCEVLKTPMMIKTQGKKKDKVGHPLQGHRDHDGTTNHDDNLTGYTSSQRSSTSLQARFSPSGSRSVASCHWRNDGDGGDSAQTAIRHGSRALVGGGAQAGMLRGLGGSS